MIPQLEPDSPGLVFQIFIDICVQNYKLELLTNQKHLENSKTIIHYLPNLPRSHPTHFSTSSFSLTGHSLGFSVLSAQNTQSSIGLSPSITQFKPNPIATTITPPHNPEPNG